MPSWGEILKEFSASARARAPQGLGSDNDSIRDKYISRFHALTERAVIVYASSWLTGNMTSDVGFSVTGGDVHAFMEVCHDVTESELDLVLHSPGGSPEAAEQIMDYLRTQFTHIRAFVPLQAKSAATMMALGCDEIWMGLHSELGPIDPQLLLPVGEGRRWAPAHAILRDFARAKDEVKSDLSNIAAWTPILRTYAGGLIESCHQTIALSQDVVKKWLTKYMLVRDENGNEVDPLLREARAKDIAEYFGSEAAYDRLRTHGRAIRIEELAQLPGLRVRRLEDDDDLQDAVLSVYHSLDLTFTRSPAVKIVENHRRARHVRLTGGGLIQVGPQLPGRAPKNSTPNVTPNRPPLTVPRDPPKPRQPRGKKRTDTT